MSHLIVLSNTWKDWIILLHCCYFLHHICTTYGKGCWQDSKSHAYAIATVPWSDYKLDFVGKGCVWKINGCGHNFSLNLDIKINFVVINFTITWQCMFGDRYSYKINPIMHAHDCRIILIDVNMVYIIIILIYGVVPMWDFSHENLSMSYKMFRDTL